ncbi:hypothetical protein ABKN59_006237 [Abortiporus biennis]
MQQPAGIVPGEEVDRAVISLLASFNPQSSATIILSTHYGAHLTYLPIFTAGYYSPAECQRHTVIQPIGQAGQTPAGESQGNLESSSAPSEKQYSQRKFNVMLKLCHEMKCAAGLISL